MSMIFEHEPGHPRCTIRYAGEVTRTDLVAGIRAQVAAGAWTCETLVDTTEATGIQSRGAAAAVTTHAITEAVYDYDLPPHGPTVIVVRDTGASIHGLARLCEELAGLDARRSRRP